MRCASAHFGLVLWRPPPPLPRGIDAAAAAIDSLFRADEGLPGMEEEEGLVKFPLFRRRTREVSDTRTSFARRRQQQRGARFRGRSRASLFFPPFFFRSLVSFGPRSYATGRSRPSPSPSVLTLYCPSAASTRSTFLHRRMAFSLRFVFLVSPRHRSRSHQEHCRLIVLPFFSLLCPVAALRSETTEARGATAVHRCRAEILLFCLVKRKKGAAVCPLPPYTLLTVLHRSGFCGS